MTSEPVALRRARLVVAYDGSGFSGFAESGGGVTTVMGVLRQTISRVVGVEVALVGAGRTDAGVHAWGQVVSGDLPASTDLANLSHRIDRMCGPAIAVRSAEWTADPEFNARFSARWRHYRYTVLNQPTAVPFLAGTVWHVPEPLDLWAMQLGCDPLIGEHDFTSFCRKPKGADDQPQPGLTRRVLHASWAQVAGDHGPLLRFEIRANAFCHQMVRSTVGTLVDVGARRIHAGDVRGILLARDRARAGQVAPPHGLCLWDVGYG
jgi:tRNA pseudouridine38-40 synthase